MSKAIIPIETRFARLTVIGEAPSRVQPNGDRVKQSKCVCDCGMEAVVRNVCLRNGHTQSCGCLQKEAASKSNTIHGHNQRRKATATYRSWSYMLTRCTNPNATGFENYGGRGITVCERWFTFANFLADMGERPDGKGISVERRSNDKGYSPDNCYWGTKKQQARNTRSNHIVTVRGVTGCLAELVELHSLSYCRVYSRIKRGWNVEMAFFAPARTQRATDS